MSHSPTTCVVVDYGIGNLFSVVNSLKSLSFDPVVSGDPSVIENAERIILPGVGAFGRASQKLASLNLDTAIKSFIQKERPFLGICVGMQLLMTTGHEFGLHPGLDVLPGNATKINPEASSESIRVPLIGWYPVQLRSPICSNTSKLLPSDPSKHSFYFVHSYECITDDPMSTTASVMHGNYSVSAVVNKGNVYGVQFHPEKSGPHGLSLLNNFMSL